MASTARTRKSRDETSSSPSSTSDSTSTTMFVVNQADFMTITSEEDDSSSRQVVQGSSSEVEANLQQGPTVSGFPSQQVPGPSGFNVFLPMGPSVPVIFTEQGIRIPGYNAPATVPEAGKEGTTTSTTATEQKEAEDAPLAGIFQLLPAGSYLPTFVNMQQLEEEDEGADEDELPQELDQEEESQEEPGQPPLMGVVGASIYEQQMLFQMPLQREASPGAWPQAIAMSPQMVPPMVSPPIISPPMMSPPMYSHMQTAQIYPSTQYGMPSPLVPFGWQAQMVQGQEQPQAYGQPLGMGFQQPQPQWPTFQAQWAGTQWQLGQLQRPQGQYMQGGPQMPQQAAQQVLTQEVQGFVDEADQRLVRSAQKRVRSVSTVPYQFSDEEFSSRGALFNEAELLAPSSRGPCLGHRVLSTQTSLQRVATPPGPVAAESSARVNIYRQGDEYEASRAAYMSLSSGRLTTEATQGTQVTYGTEACPAMQDLQSKSIVFGLHDARVHVEDPWMTLGTQTIQEFMAPASAAPCLQDTEHVQVQRPVGMQPAKIFSDPQHATLGIQAVEKPLGRPHIALGVQTMEESTQLPSRAVGLQVTQKYAEVPHTADGMHVVREHEEALRPTVGLQIIPQPTGPPHIALAVQATGQSAFEPHSVVTRTQTIQEHGEPPCVSFGMQTTERLEPRAVTGITAAQGRVLSPRVVSAVHVADMHVESLQPNLQVQCPERPQVSQSVQATSVISIPVATYGGTMEVLRSPTQAHIPEAPFRNTVCQAVQITSVESLPLVAQHGAQTMISVEQLQVGMGAQPHVASPMSVGSGLPRQQRDISVQHGGVFQPVPAPRSPSPARKLYDLEIQCNYEQPLETARSITIVGVQQECELPDRHQTDFGIQCTLQPHERIVKAVTTLPPRSLHDAEVQSGHEPIMEPLPEPPSHDFGVQCVYEPDQVMTGDMYQARNRPLYDLMEQGHVRAKWNEEGLFQDGGRLTRDFEGQYNGPVTTSPLPMTPHVLHETVAIGVGDGGPENVIHANYRFNQGPMPHVKSGLSVSSSLSSVLLLGHSHLPGMMSAATQVAEMDHYSPSPAFASPAPKTETAAYPCVAVCSRNTINHACTLNVSSYPGRLSQTPKIRDAVFQVGEPAPAMHPFGLPRSQYLSRELDGRTPFGEAAIQTLAMSLAPPGSTPPLSPPSSPYQLGPFGTSAAGHTPRSGSPTRDAGLQSDGGFANFRGSPLGGLFRHESVAELAEQAEGPSHDIMIQADTLTPNAGRAWGPWQVRRRTPAAGTVEVYPCGHLPQVLQTRDLPPSPPPLSPPPHSPYLGPQGWQVPVVVEHTVGIGGDVVRLLALRQQQSLPSGERPSLADKAVSEGPLVGPAWGSTDGEQDYVDQGSSQVEQSSGGGEYLPAGAMLGAAGLAAEAEPAAETARRSSIETTSNVTRTTKVASIVPEVTVACFLLALLLVLVASAALLSWTTRRHSRVVLAGQATKKALRPSNATYIIPPFSILPHDRPLQTIDSSLYVKFTSGSPDHTGSPPGSRTYEVCTTDFCVKEGQMLRYLRDSAVDPCRNFYEYVCGQWLSQQPSDATYVDVDGALAADIEARMQQFLSGPEKSSIRPLFIFWTNCNRQGTTPRDRALSHARTLGLELPGSQASSSPERLMVLAVTLAQEFGLFALLTVELDGDPEGKAQHVLAIDEPELAWGRMKPPLVTTDHTVYWAMLIKAAQPLAALLLTDYSAVQSATHNFAHITMAMTNVSVAHRHLSDRMGHYEMRGYRELSRLDPLLNGLFGSSHDLRPSSRVLVKAPRFVELVNTLLASEREALHQYMVLLALLHLSPFLDLPEAPSMFFGSLTGGTVSWEASPPRWRVCLRLAERTLPNLMQMAYEQVFKGSPIFDEVMGDIMVEEVRNGLVEYIDRLNLLDAWSKIIAKIKVRNTKVYTFYPIVLADPKNLAAYVRKLERSVSWDGDIMEYYIRLRGFLAQMKERDDTLNFFLPRWKHSIFDPECVYYPRRDVVYVPVGFFNLTVPTSPRERMFHVPRSGPLLVGCFFRAILQNINLYKPEGLWWTEATQAAFQESMACLEERRNEMMYQHAGINMQDANRGLNLQGLSDIEDSVAVRISAKVYDDQLFTNRYLNRDYRLPGAEHLSSKQLFFIYLARSHCEAPSVTKSLEDIRCSYKSKGRYRTNLALSNSREFIDAFQCSPGTEMNPSKQCSVWS